MSRKEHKADRLSRSCGPDGTVLVYEDDNGWQMKPVADPVKFTRRRNEWVITKDFKRNQ